MSSSASAATVDVAIRPSRTLAGVLAAAHGGAIVCVMITALPLWARLSLTVLVAAGLWHSLTRYVLQRRPDAITGLRCDGDGRWFVRWRTGVVEPVSLLPDSYLHPAVVVVNLRVEADRRRRAVILLADNVDPESFRRLRVCLKLGKRAFGTSPGARGSPTDAA